MDQGMFRCIGSSLFLKNKFGMGYSLILAKINNKVSSEPIISLIKNKIKDSQIVSDVSS